MLSVPYTERTHLSDGIMDIVGNENADTSIVQTSWSLEDTVHNVEVVGDYTDACISCITSRATHGYTLH